MNLPRHNITSHASAPVFVNAHFASVLPQGSVSMGGVAAEDSVAHKKAGTKQRLRDHEGLSAGPSSPRRGASKDDQHGLASKSDGAEEQAGDRMIACATREGFFVARADPFAMVARRDFPAMQGGLSHAALIDDSSLMVLVGGGRVPRFAPNKVILWDEDADVKVAIKRQSAAFASEDVGPSNAEVGSDDGTASLAASTVFSVGREQEFQADDVPGEGEEDEIVAEVIDPNDSQELQKSTKADDATGSILPLLQDSTQSLRPSSPHEESTTPGMSASLSASSANMEDPFRAPSPPTSEPDAVRNASPPTSTMIEDTPASERGDSTEARDTSADASGSHSSNATSQERSDEPQYRLVKGSEVAELEFGEAVESIAVQSFSVPHVGASVDRRDTARLGGKVTILIVSLQRKAVIFEMGAHLAAQSSTSWGIRQRLVVQCHASSARCAPSMAAIQDTNCVLIAVPGRQSGHVQLISMAFSQTTRTSIVSSIAGASTIIAAHSNAIVCMALSSDARLLCTASERGTLLRVWSTLGRRGKGAAAAATQQMSVVLQGELRRGTDAARILSMAWTPDSAMLAAASDKGTIHFFAVDALQHGQPTSAAAATAWSPPPASKTTSSGGFTLSQQANRYLPSALQQFAQSLPTSFVPTYFRSQWSFAQYKITLRVFSGRSRDGLKYVKPPPPSRRRAAAGQQRARDGGQRAAADDEDDGEAAFDSIGDAVVPDRARNLEGGWANLRGRVHDIRRGERSIEESIWLTWVPARPASNHSAFAASPTASSSSSSSPSTSAASTRKRDESVPSAGVLPYHLVAVTSAGGHYRLAVSRNVGPHHPPSSTSSTAAAPSTTVLNMYKQDNRSSGSSSNQQDPQAGGVCWLVEYTPFGMRDEWLE